MDNTKRVSAGKAAGKRRRRAGMEVADGFEYPDQAAAAGSDAGAPAPPVGHGGRDSISGSSSETSSSSSSYVPASDSDSVEGSHMGSSDFELTSSGGEEEVAAAPTQAAPARTRAGAGGLHGMSTSRGCSPRH